MDIWMWAVVMLGWTALSFIAGMVIGKAIGVADAKERVNRSEEDAFVAETKLRTLENAIDQTVEQRLERKVRDWFPSQSDADEAFHQAEVMALTRATRDAGRRHPPREDGGPEARIGKIHVSKGRRARGSESREHPPGRV